MISPGNFVNAAAATFGGVDHVQLENLNDPKKRTAPLVTGRLEGQLDG